MKPTPAQRAAFKALRQRSNWEWLGHRIRQRPYGDHYYLYYHLCNIDFAVHRGARYMAIHNFPRSLDEVKDTLRRVLDKHYMGTTDRAFEDRSLSLWVALTGPDTLEQLRRDRSYVDPEVFELLPEWTPVRVWYCWVCGEPCAVSEVRSYLWYSIHHRNGNRRGRRCDETKIAKQYYSLTWKQRNTMDKLLMYASRTPEVVHLARAQLALFELEHEIRSRNERARRVVQPAVQDRADGTGTA